MKRAGGGGAGGAAAAGGAAGAGGAYTDDYRLSGSKREAEITTADLELGQLLKAGTRCFAKYRDGTERRAIVIEKRPVRNDDGQETGLHRFYVHYLDFNRRMDSWVEQRDTRYDPEGDAQEKQEAKHKAEQHAKAAAAAAAAAAGSGGAGKGGKGGKGHEGAAGSSSSGVGTSSAGAGGGHSSGHGSSGGAAAVGVEKEIVDADGTILRVHKREDGELVVDFVEPEHESGGISEAKLRDHEEVTKVKNVNYIELGKYRMETWYFSPIPKEYWLDGFIDTLYICEFCLKFHRRKGDLLHHMTKCSARSPPGDLIYRGADNICMWEVDGSKDKQFCRNLSYIAKMFLDHKTLYYDVDLFFYYVMTEQDEYGHHVVGYFSKEKDCEYGYNLACILALPCHQRKGYGRFLIQFSYELSKKEGKVGSPEKPLSDLGLLSYRSFWSWQILGILRRLTDEEISIQQLQILTSFKQEDIISTLQHLGLVRYMGGQHVIVAPAEVVEKEFARLDGKPGPVVDPARIHWAAYRPPGIKKDKWSLAAKLGQGEG